MRKVYARVFAGPLPVEPEFLTPEVPAPSTSGLPSAAVVPRRPSIPAEERIGRRAASLHTAPRARSWPRWLIAFLLLCGAAFCGLQASLPQRMNSLLLAVTAQQPALERHVDTPPEITGLRFVSVDEFAADEDDEWLGDDDDDRTVVSASGWRMKSVADFEPGDTILAFNHATGKPEQRTVVRKFERTSDHLRLLDVKSPDGQTQTIKTTDEHPFWRIGSGKYVLAGKLRLGDQFRSPSGTPLTVIGTTREPHPEGVPVYNVEVEGHHNYFVAASRDAQPLLAHNTCKVGDLLDMAEKSDGRKAWVKYQNGAENAVKNRAPALSYDNSGYGGRNYVKFDGYRTNKAGNVTHMIDRKMNVMFTEKAIRQANKQSAALAQNSLKGIWEVPDEAAKNAAERLLRDNGIGNITVNVVPQ